MTSKYASVIDQYIHDGHGSSNTVTFQCTTHVTYNYVVNCLKKKKDKVCTRASSPPKYYGTQQYTTQCLLIKA